MWVNSKATLTLQNAPPLSIFVVKTYIKRYFLSQLSTRKYRNAMISINGCRVANTRAIVK